MYKALVIGCGNIGAMYDFNNDQVQSHAKGFYLNPKFSLSVFDINKKIAEKVSARYQSEIVNVIDEKTLSEFDCVSICTPTDTHTSLLRIAVSAGVKVIICEKPISYSLEELSAIKSIYLNGNSRIIVNYIRRFQPAFIEFKKIVTSLLANELLTNVCIRYQKGFLNNCSHAFDTIEFLTGSELNLVEIKKHNVIFDHYPDDPTLSMQALWNNVNLSITGLSNVSFSFFEFDLYFQHYKICIKNAGQNIEFYKAEKGDQFLLPLQIQDQFTRELCLNNYMTNVIDRVYLLLSNKKQKDNFLESLSLNQKMLNFLIY